MKPRLILTELVHLIGTAVYFAAAIIGLAFFLLTNWLLGYKSDDYKGGGLE